MTQIKSVQIIGVPIDLGANIRGANMGPAAIRIAELQRKIGKLNVEIVDSGDIHVPIRETIEKEDADNKYLKQITQVCSDLESKVYNSLKDGVTPIVIGGDHCIAMGSVAGTSRYFREKEESIGLIWIDAHADLNTPESSPSGNIHGMPLSALLGDGHSDLVNLGGFKGKIKPENTVLIGIRDIDGEEKEICKKSGIRYFTMREIDERGMMSVMIESIKLASNGTSGIHLSIDLDGIDPLYAPGVSTPVTGGLSYRETHLALEMLADTNKLATIEVVELNPMNDIDHKSASLSVELIQSALGKSIV
jgi:arginase